MSASLQGLAADVLAPSRLGISESAYRENVEAIADQLALDDEEQSPQQREADVEEAEWMIGVLYAAGFTVTRIAR